MAHASTLVVADPTADLYTIGVEEEFHVVDLDSGALVPDGASILPDRDDFTHELQQSCVETRTAVCTTLDELRDELVRLRGRLVAAAEQAGLGVVSAGTVPVADLEAQRITPSPRYEHLLQHYRHMAREQLICSCQTHIGFDDRDEAIAVMNQVRPWLPCLLALSASSPFWLGSDTGYASYRTQVWRRWPTAGIPEAFDSYEEYQEMTRLLVDCGGIGDPGMLYWDVRPSAHIDTLEFRVADACPTIDETLLQTALARGLARTEHEALLAGAPTLQVRTELLRLSSWRAARFGLDGELVEPLTVSAQPARVLVERLLMRIRPALEEAGDWPFVREQVDRLLTDGGSAQRQRAVLERRGDPRDVVAALVAETNPSAGH